MTSEKLMLYTCSRNGTNHIEQEAPKVINQNKFEGAIRAAGYTQEKLAKEMNISANTLTTKKKKGTFTLAQVDKVCTILGIEKPEDKCEIFLQS